VKQNTNAVVFCTLYIIHFISEMHYAARAYIIILSSLAHLYVQGGPKIKPPTFVHKDRL